jgi:hypothetical protein
MLVPYFGTPGWSARFGSWPCNAQDHARILVARVRFMLEIWAMGVSITTPLDSSTVQGGHSVEWKLGLLPEHCEDDTFCCYCFRN